MEETRIEMQNLIEQEVKDKTRCRGTRMEDVEFYAYLSSRPEITQKVKEIVCNPKRKKFIEDYKESRKK